MYGKLIAVFAVAAGVVSAQAFTFNFRSTGTSVHSGTSFSVTDTTLTGYIAGSPLPAYSFVSVAYSDTASFAGSSLTGTVSGSGTLTIFETASSSNKALAFNFSGAASRTSGANLDHVSFSNMAISLSGSGLAGTGTFSSNVVATSTGSDLGRSQTTFFSQLRAVPEPTSMAVLALGGFGLAARRRRR